MKQEMIQKEEAFQPVRHSERLLGSGHGQRDTFCLGKDHEVFLYLLQGLDPYRCSQRRMEGRVAAPLSLVRQRKLLPVAGKVARDLEPPNQGVVGRMKPVGAIMDA